MKKYMKKSIYCQLKDLEISVVRLLFTNIQSNLRPPTITQARIMSYILEHKKEEIYQKDLEKTLGLSRATVSEVLGTMEKRGLIIRLQNPNDSRTKQIILTEKIPEKQKEFQENIDKIEKTITDGIPLEELEQFSLTLEKMKSNVNNKYNK